LISRARLLLALKMAEIILTGFDAASGENRRVGVVDVLVATGTVGGGEHPPLSGTGNPNGAVTGYFGQAYLDTAANLWYKCFSDPSGTAWLAIGVGLVGDAASISGSGDPNGAITGTFGQEYLDTVSGLWYKCVSSPSGTSWALLGAGGGPIAGLQYGEAAIANDSETVVVTLPTPYAGTTYSVSTQIVNVTDTTKLAFFTVVTARTVNSFTVKLSGKVPTANYRLSWVTKE